MDFYDNVFFPTLKKRKIKNILILGDIFDNRKNIDFNTLCRIKSDFFDKLKTYKVHGILGNHDVYYKNTNNVNSVGLLLQEYKNIKIYDEPTEIEFDGVSFLMLPWINNENEEEYLKICRESNADILCAHLHLSGCRMSKGQISDGGHERNLFKTFDRVWSGHFHHKSLTDNVLYLGNPYEMYWNDFDDERGFHIFDTKSKELEYIINPYRLHFKIFYDDTKEEQIDFKTYEGKYVKLFIVNKENDIKFRETLNELGNYAADIKIIESNLHIKDMEENIDNIEIKGTIDIFNEYIDSIDMNVDKAEIKSFIEKTYNDCLIDD